MNFTISKYIAVTAASILLMSTPVALGMHPIAPTVDHGRTESLACGTVMPESIVLAANDNSKPDDKEKTTSGSVSKGSETESKTTVEGKEKSSNTKPRPLKPFVPSEKIPGGQAVDFPVDI